MSDNPPIGEEHRGQSNVRKRSQVYNPKTGRWEKRDTETGKVLDVRADKKPFKNVDVSSANKLCDNLLSAYYNLPKDERPKTFDEIVALFEVVFQQSDITISAPNEIPKFPKIDVFYKRDDKKNRSISIRFDFENKEQENYWRPILERDISIDSEGGL